MSDGVFNDALPKEVLWEALNNLFDGIWIVHRSGRILFVNKANERHYPFGSAELIGQNINDLIADGRLPQSVAMRCLAQGSPCTLKTVTSTGRWLYITAIPTLCNESGTFDIAVCNNRDITEILELTEENERNKNLLAQLSSESATIDLLGHGKDLVAKSAKLLELIDVIRRVAPYRTNILIQGESGTGKEVLTKLIHQLSGVPRATFFAVNCAAIPENLLESELFGYERGAFTGANRAKPGLFELCHDGTFMLDEIGDLSLPLQSKLLRVIQERKMTRLGATRATTLGEIRFISVTNKNLEEMAAQKLFRHDLLYRLNVVTLNVPPLRERIEDIEPLIHDIWTKLTNKYRTNKTLLPRAIECFVRYSWPGNVRELQNVLERLFILHENIIDIPQLPPEIKATDESLMQCGLKEALANYEHFLLETALAKHRTIGETARILKMDFSSIWRKIRKYDLSVPGDPQP